MKDYDFCGWATKNDLKCADGRVIRRDAFKIQDGARVPLLWNHQHNSPENCLGHAILENRPEGVYAYGKFNGSKAGMAAKESVLNGDVVSLSIWANGLDQRGNEVHHGVIREVSLVLAGANPGAFIESVIAHGYPAEDFDEEAIFYTGEGIFLRHAEEPKKEEPPKEEGSKEGETVKDIYETLTDKQKQAVAIIVGMAIQDAKKETDEEGEEEGMKHNIFEGSEGMETPFLSHSERMEIIESAKKCGSLRDAIGAYLETENGAALLHAIDTAGMTVSTGTQNYGFRDPDMLFPEFKSLQTQPEWLSRNMDWVQKVMGAVHRTPFSRIKSVFADITEDDARARGYIKGNMKKEEFFTLLKRTTTPQTIYKKQKLDRDDVVDITDFDVVAWIRAEMRMMLDEEIARAVLIGDGRSTASDDHISEDHIRPIVSDVPLFNTVIKVKVPAGADEAAIAKATVNAIIRGRKHYKGSGTPTFFTTEDSITEMLLIEDQIGHKLYKTETELATTLRVREAVPVEVMGNQKISIKEGSTTKDYPLIGVIVNLADYNIGADRGGQISMFDDFDIDYNQMKYLIETRISGALIRPYSALTIVLDQATTTSSGGSSGGNQ